MNGTPVSGCDGGLISDAELDRVHTEGIGQLIHGRLDCQEAGRLSGRADVFSPRKIERRQAVARQTVRSRVKAAGGSGRLLGIFGMGAGIHVDLVGDGDESAVRFGGEANALAGCRAQAQEVEHLLPGHGDLDRLIQTAGGERREDGFGVDAELGSKAPADVRGDDTESAAGRCGACWQSRCGRNRRSGRSHRW